MIIDEIYQRIKRLPVEHPSPELRDQVKLLPIPQGRPDVRPDVSLSRIFHMGRAPLLSTRPMSYHSPKQPRKPRVTWRTPAINTPYSGNGLSTKPVKNSIHDTTTLMAEQLRLGRDFEPVLWKGTRAATRGIATGLLL